MDNTTPPRLRPLAEYEPVGVLSTSVVLLELARLELDCASPDERLGLIRAQAKVRELAGIPAGYV